MFGRAVQDCWHLGNRLKHHPSTWQEHIHCNVTIRRRSWTENKLHDFGWKDNFYPLVVIDPGSFIWSWVLTWEIRDLLGPIETYRTYWETRDLLSQCSTLATAHRWTYLFMWRVSCSAQDMLFLCWKPWIINWWQWWRSAYSRGYKTMITVMMETMTMMEIMKTTTINGMWRKTTNNKTTKTHSQFNQVAVLASVLFMVD